MKKDEIYALIRREWRMFNDDCVAYLGEMFKRIRDSLAVNSPKYRELKAQAERYLDYLKDAEKELERQRELAGRTSRYESEIELLEKDLEIARRTAREEGILKIGLQRAEKKAGELERQLTAERRRQKCMKAGMRRTELGKLLASYRDARSSEAIIVCDHKGVVCFSTFGAADILGRCPDNKMVGSVIYGDKYEARKVIRHFNRASSGLLHLVDSKGKKIHAEVQVQPEEFDYPNAYEGIDRVRYATVLRFKKAPLRRLLAGIGFDKYQFIQDSFKEDMLGQRKPEDFGVQAT